MKQIKKDQGIITISKYTKSSKQKIICSLISIIAGIFGIIFSLIGYFQIDFSLSRAKEMNSIIYNTENTEDYSAIISNYYQAISAYSELIEENRNQNSNNIELQEFRNQIYELTVSLSDINDKIDEIESAIEYNNNHDIISSIITGVCTIIAALIAAGVAIKVAKIKANDKE